MAQLLLAPLLLSFLLLSSFSLPASFSVRVLAAGSMVYDVGSISAKYDIFRN